MTLLNTIIVTIFTVGGAAALTALARGTDLWRSGTQRTEARAIQNLERYRKAADLRAAAAELRSNYVQDVADFWRRRAGNLEYVISTKMGDSEVPPLPPLPVPPVEIAELPENARTLDEASHND